MRGLGGGGRERIFTTENAENHEDARSFCHDIRHGTNLNRARTARIY